MNIYLLSTFDNGGTVVDTELIEMNMTQFLPLKNSWSNGEGKHINANIQKNGTSVEMKVSKGAI